MNDLFKRILSSIVLLILTFYCIIKGSYFFVILLIIIFLISSLEWYKMTKTKSYSIFGFIYLIFSLFCVYQLRFSFNDNISIFIYVTIICILSDIGGFIFGKILKGPKLTKYSPNKTYSGAIGSFLMSLCIIPFNLIIDISTINLILFTLIISAVSQLGDIFVSYFKRISKLKDTGKIIPGHGGLLDRIDGMIFAFPISYFIIFFNIIDFI